MGGGTVDNFIADYWIKKTLRWCWSRETASPGCQAAWTPENPGFGQCAVTALLVQDLLGGELMRTEVPGFGSHYYNRLDSGMPVDLTCHQFPEGTDVPAGEPVSRDRVLKSPRAVQAGTAERYERLKEAYKAHRRDWPWPEHARGCVNHLW